MLWKASDASICMYYNVYHKNHMSVGVTLAHAWMAAGKVEPIGSPLQVLGQDETLPKRLAR